MATNFGQFLKEKRLALDLSLREFARRVGVQPSNYCNVEAGVLPPPPADTLEKLAKALGLKKGTPDYETRYSPPVCIGARKTRIMGRPNKSLISTSYVERSNLSMRMGM